jgi:TP901 family phage tail tape measure protein
MATAMSKVASAANTAGVDIDKLNGMLSTVISVTRESPETIGTAFRSIFARMGDLKLGKTDEDGVGLGKVSGQLQGLGIEILDQQGNMREMGNIIEDVAKKWEG